VPSFFDEMTETGGVRAPYAEIARWLAETPADLLGLKRRQAEEIFRRIGITFTVYSDEGGTERLIPFDIIPRILAAQEWAVLADGLAQRAKALNAFIADAYHDRDIIRAGRIPEALILRNAAFRPEMQGFDPPGGIYAHIAGIDLVRVGPSVFYVLENRETMMRLFPDLFARHRVAPVSSYPEDLLETLKSVAPPNCDHAPVVCVLTPGSLNSAYYEHAFLADEMGVELVEGADLCVVDNVAWLRTTEGRRRVDVIYRRVDDDFLDPLTFRADSLLGTPGLFAAYRAGNLTLANAVGCGIADDKSVYPHVPEMIRFYLGEEPLLRNVPTHCCAEPGELAYVLEHLHELVVKEVHGSGGYGMLVGPHATIAQRQDFAARLKARPESYIAQPTLALSTCPTFVESGIAPRHVDFRPFVLSGKEVRITPGGLTRVALGEGSLVVNSSQGGGTKDTWVLEA
jgi:uncharacterized circularly permuted ATP-grasp superfamily protein